MRGARALGESPAVCADCLGGDAHTRQVSFARTDGRLPQGPRWRAGRPATPDSPLTCPLCQVAFSDERGRVKTVQATGVAKEKIGSLTLKFYNFYVETSVTVGKKLEVCLLHC